MDDFLNAISSDPGNCVRAWYVETLRKIQPKDVRRQRVQTLVDTFDCLDPVQQRHVVHLIRCFHMYYMLRVSTPPPLNITTSFEAALAILYSPRERCRLLRKNGIYSMLTRDR